jgi:hypothetical protein
VSVTHRTAVAFLCILLSRTDCAQAEWFDAPEHRARLAAGEIIVTSESATDVPRGRFHAAVQIAAEPEAIWAVMTDCARAPSFVPNLKRCERVEAAADGTWEVLRHEVKYLWLWPRIRYVFRADYRRPQRIDFRRVSGDLKEQEGSWVLERLADGTGTIVGYEVYLDPGTWVPRSIVQRALARDLPALMSALRTRVQNEQRQEP